MKRTVLIPESMGVASEGASMASFHEAGPGASPRATLQAIRVGPIAQSIAKPLIVNGHYLHSYPGGTKLAFGAFLGSALLGVLTPWRRSEARLSTRRRSQAGRLRDTYSSLALRPVAAEQRVAGAGDRASCVEAAHVS